MKEQGEWNQSPLVKRLFQLSDRQPKLKSFSPGSYSFISSTHLFSPPLSLHSVRRMKTRGSEVIYSHLNWLNVFRIILSHSYHFIKTVLHCLKCTFHIHLMVLLLQTCILNSTAAERKLVTSMEKSLIRTLMDNYASYGVIGRPVNDSRMQITVEFGLVLVQILDLDESKQTLRTNCWEQWRWTDSLLTWNPEEHNNIRKIRIFREQVWTPDIKLFNFADERLNDHREARLVVSYTGSVLWVPQVLYKSTCYVDVTFFPFDVQNCAMEFGSWTYDESQLDITWWRGDDNVSQPYIDYENYLPSNEWRTDGEDEAKFSVTEKKRALLGERLKRNQTYTDNQGRNQTKYFNTLKYRVKLERNSSFYIFILVLPCILLSALTSIVFWLPPESPAKLMLSMNILSAFFVLMLLLAESIPTAVDSFPLLGGFFCFNMGMIALSTFLVTFVINLYLRGDRLGNVPRWIRKFLIDGLGRILLVRQYMPLPDVAATEVVQRSSSPSKTNSSTAASGCTGSQRRRIHVPPLNHGNKFIMSEAGNAPRLPALDNERDPELGLDRTRRLFNKSGDLSGEENSPHIVSGFPLSNNSGQTNILYSNLSDTSYRQRHPVSVSQSMNAQQSEPDDLTGLVPSSDFNDLPHAYHQSNHLQAQPASSVISQAPTSNDLQGVVDAQDSPVLFLSGTLLERDVREIKRYVSRYINRQKETDRKNQLCMEWRALASVLDRLFFLVYVLIILLALAFVYGSGQRTRKDHTK